MDFQFFTSDDCCIYYRDDLRDDNLRTETAQQESAEENKKQVSQSCDDQTENNSLNTDKISDQTNYEHEHMLEEIQCESEINGEPNENECARHQTNLQQIGDEQMLGLSQDDSDSDSIVIMDHPHDVIRQQETVDDEIQQAQSDDDGIYIIDSPQQTYEQDGTPEGEFKQVSKKRMKVTKSRSIFCRCIKCFQTIALTNNTLFALIYGCTCLEFYRLV